MLLLLLMGESLPLTPAESPVSLLPPLAAEPLSLRLGGEDVHRALCTAFATGSEFEGWGSEEKLLDSKFESSGSSLIMSVLFDDTSGGCGLWLCWSTLMVRGSGLTILQTGSVVLCPSLDSSSMASVLKITLKCVFSEEVMVNVFDSDLSFLLTWIRERTEQGRLRKYSHKSSLFQRPKFRSDSSSLTLVDSGNSPQVHCMWDSALSILSEGLTINSESLLGEKAWDKPWLRGKEKQICLFTCLCCALADGSMFTSIHTCRLLANPHQTVDNHQGCVWLQVIWGQCLALWSLMVT